MDKKVKLLKTLLEKAGLDTQNSQVVAEAAMKPAPVLPVQTHSLTQAEADIQVNAALNTMSAIPEADLDAMIAKAEKFK